DIERVLHLDRQARDEIAKRLLKRKRNGCGQQRGGREDRARINIGRSQRDEKQDDVDDALNDVSKDARYGSRPRALSSKARLERDEHHAASDTRKEQDGANE